MAHGVRKVIPEHRYAEFLHKYRRRFRLLLYARGVPWHAVDDVFQETAIALIHATEKGLQHTAETPYPLVYTTVQFMAMKYHRERRSLAWLHWPMPEDAGVPGWAEERIDAAAVLKVTEAMPLKLRTAIDHIIDGGDRGTYAEHMDITPGQANILLVEARAYLRRKLPTHAQDLTDTAARRTHRRRANPATGAEHRQ